jgi:TonB family protein
MQKWMVLLAGLCVSLGVSAQTTRVYLNRQGLEISSPKRAAFYRDIERLSDSLYIVKHYSGGGVLLWKSDMKQLSPELALNRITYYPDGKISKHEDISGWTIELYPSGQVKAKYARSKEGALDGEVVCFYENGQALRRDLYQQGTLVSGICYDESGAEVPHYPFFELASFGKRLPGVDGFMQEWVYRNLRYPKFALNRMIQGVVLVGFTLKANGLVDDVRLLQGVERNLDAEAMRLVTSSPAWRSPAMINKKPVDSYFIAPVAFVIE